MIEPAPEQEEPAASAEAPGTIHPVTVDKAEDWNRVIDAIRSAPGQVARVWHPDPLSALIELKDGSNAEVLVGEPAYQLVNGDIIKP